MSNTETNSTETIGQDNEVQENKEQKAKRGKSQQKPIRAFPQYTIEESLVIAKSIAQNNAGNPWSIEQIGESIGFTPTSNIYFYLSSSSRDYGFTTGTSRGKTIGLTPLGRKVAFPESPQTEKESIVEAFFNIELFKNVYEYYNGGNLPEDKYLCNTMREVFNVDSSFHQEFIKIFKTNLAYLNRLVPDLNMRISNESATDNMDSNLYNEVKINTNTIENSTLFVIMPFTEKTNNYPRGYFDEVFSSLIVPAAAEAGFNAKTAKRSGSDIIHSTIISEIYNAQIILADLTEHNPNVLFELGLAIAFKKKVALIRSKGTAPIFDVDNSMRVFDYDSNLWKSTIERDVPNLSKHIEATLGTDESMYLDIFLKR